MSGKKPLPQNRNSVQKMREEGFKKKRKRELHKFNILSATVFNCGLSKTNFLFSGFGNSFEGNRCVETSSSYLFGFTKKVRFFIF